MLKGCAVLAARPVVKGWREFDVSRHCQTPLGSLRPHAFWARGVPGKRPIKAISPWL
jgi:hypothetical protein